MSENANQRSRANTAPGATRTATSSRRSVRASGVEAAPNKLHRPHPSTASAASPSARPKAAAAAEPKTSPTPVIAAARGSTQTNGVATPAARTRGSPQQSSPPTAATAVGRPSTSRARPSSTRSPLSSTHPTTPGATATTSSTRQAAPRRAATHPAPLSTPAHTVGAAPTTQNHVLGADDPVFAHRHSQRRASSTGSAMSVSALAVGGQRFELLAANEPVPEIPQGLEKDLVRQYTENLLRLPLSEVERVVRTMCQDTDFKLVMTYMKGEQLRLKNEAKHERSRSAPAGGSGSATTRTRTATPGAASLVTPAARTAKADKASKNAKKRSTSVPAGASAAATAKPGWVKTPKVGETTAEASQRARSGRITARVVTPSLTTSRRRGAADVMTPARQEAALERFHVAFSNEVRYVFLEDAGHLCNARRIRFYYEQPAMVRSRNIVIPDEALRPVYGQVVNKLLYRTLGWSEQECKPYTAAVVDIVIQQMSEPQDNEGSDSDDE